MGTLGLISPVGKGQISFLGDRIAQCNVYRLDSSAVGIVQLAHEADESILCR